MKKRRSLGFIAVLLAVLLISSFSAHAELLNRGSDILGNRLIYDSDLNVTWYDYTNLVNSWQSQRDWASTLTVTFGGTIYDDWRLPTTTDGIYVHSYDGSTTGGYNISSSEMGHLFYTELGNKAFYDTHGNWPQPGWGLTNTGPFQNLKPYSYWTGTEYGANPIYAWRFNLSYGDQGYWGKTDTLGGGSGLAIRSGDVAVVPEPISSILFVTGGMLLAGKSYLRKKRHNHVLQ